MAKRDAGSREDTLAVEMLAHHGQLVRVARRFLKDEHLAEDAVGSAYLRAWVSRNQLRDPGKLLPWLRTICRREANRIRRQLQQWPPGEAGGVNVSLAAGAGREPHGLAVEELFSCLPDKHRRCAWLYFAEGRSPQQIAGALGLPVTTVRGRLRLARERLRKERNMYARQNTKEPVQRCSDGKLVWGKLSIRLLGTCWTDARSIYNAAGKRLSRLPLTIQRGGVMPPSSDRPFGPDPWTGPLVWAFWEVAGPQAERRNVKMITEAFDTSTGVACLPSGHGETRSAGRKDLLEFYFAVPENVRSVRLDSKLFGSEDRKSGHIWRWNFGFDRGLDTWICSGRAGWGAACVLPPRPARTSGHSRLNVTFCSSIVETACRVFGLDEARQEVAPVMEASGRANAPEGHLRVAEVELPLPPDEIFGVALYPRRSVCVDWGRVVIPR
jgi:RNA polymerase sigma-70 factor (ECF subfamily)